MPLGDAENLLKKASVGRLGTACQNEPYIIPLNFVYTDGKIFFHCAIKGKKIEYITRNPRVCFEVDEFISLGGGEKACDFTTYYRSVISYGQARIIENSKEKAEALQKLLEKYTTERPEPVFNETMLRRVKVIEIVIEKLTGKQNLP